MAPITVMVNAEAKALSETAKLTLKMSWNVAQSHSQNSLGTEHILYSLLSQKTSRAHVLLGDMGIDLNELSITLEEFLDHQTEGMVDDSEAVKLQNNKRALKKQRCFRSVWC
jgi:ATP-dependent Clp protease ATP-binding subunit ClpA